MKGLRLFSVLIIGLLCLSFGIAMAQDATQEATPDPNIPVIPSKPLIPCPTDVTAATVCDKIATKAEDMVGVWAVYFLGEPSFVRFNADGTYVYGATAEGTSTVTADLPSGTSSFDGDGMWTTTFDPLPECKTGRYRVRVILVGGKPSALNLGLVEDCFNLRSSDYGFTMLRIGD